MEKAIEIKRRAQRCLQGGDLDGAVNEYEKLTRVDNCEPIHFVLLADLLFKRGDGDEAVRSYLQAVDAYSSAGLYKNAIAVCKKMTRLSLASGVILQRLAELHALDGLTTEAALYYQELAEFQAHEQHFKEAAGSAQRAFETCADNVRLLERAGDWLVQAGDARAAADAWAEAAHQYSRRGLRDEAAQAEARAQELAPAAEEPAPSAVTETAVPPTTPSATTVGEPEGVAEPGPPGDAAAVEGLEQRRVFAPPVAAPDEPSETAAAPAASPAAGHATDVTPPVPAGLCFGEAPRSAEPSSDPEVIEALLQSAAAQLRKGNREAAGEALVEAARAYEGLGRLDSAASIYRNLGRSTQATPEILGLWLRNCELRENGPEAAEVACALGDRALNDGDHAGARDWFGRALRHSPDCKLALRRMERLGPGPTAAPAPGGAEASTEADGRVEIAVGRAQAVTLDLGSLLAEFQRGVDSQVSGDPQSHYDLGMTYREMGLADQAVESFRAAARHPDFAGRAAEMIGRTLLDQGRFDEAAEEFHRALETLTGGPEQLVGLRFHLGLAHEVAGRTAEALAEFERVYAIQPSYPDVAQKIRVLRRALESV